MNPYQAIQDRFGLIVPELFRVLVERHVIDGENPDGLYLTDLRWISPAAIANYEFLPFEAPGLIPFAKSARVDLYAWRVNSVSALHEAAPVVFCPRDCNSASYFASDFTAAIYRLLLEEFSGTWLPDYFGPDEALRCLRWYPYLVSSCLPESWVATLKRISAGPLLDFEGGGGFTGFFSQDECKRIVTQDLAFPLLNAEFKHYLDDV